MSQITFKPINSWMEKEWMVLLTDESRKRPELMWIRSAFELYDDQRIARKLGLTTRSYRKAARQYGAELRWTKRYKDMSSQQFMIFWSKEEAQKFIDEFLAAQVLAMRMVQNG